MITVGICLIYYASALWLFQIYAWISDGVWTPYPVSAAWQSFFGQPSISLPVVDMVWVWFMDWPLTLALVILGLALIGSKLGIRRLRAIRQGQIRRKWVAEQCDAAGFQSWLIPSMVAKFERRTKRGSRIVGGERRV